MQDERQPGRLSLFKSQKRPMRSVQPPVANMRYQCLCALLVIAVLSSAQAEKDHNKTDIIIGDLVRFVRHLQPVSWGLTAFRIFTQEQSLVNSL